MPGQKTGLNESDSPADDPVSVSDEGADALSREPEAESTSPVGTDAVEQTDAVEDSPEKAAIAFLAKPKQLDADPENPVGSTPVEQTDKSRDPKGRFQPQEQKPAQAKPDKASDPFADVPADELLHWKGKTRERFSKIHSRATTAEAALAQRTREFEESKPHIEYGKVFSDVLQAPGVLEDIKHVKNDQIAGSIQVQAAAMRVAGAIQSGKQPADRDVALVEGLQGNLDALLEAMGKPRTPAAPAQFTGNLPEDLQDMVGVYKQLSEEEARAIAAMRAAKAPRKAAPVAQTAQPTQAPARSAVAAPVQPTSAPARGWTDEDEQLNEQRVIRELEKDGIRGDAATQHYETVLWPKMVARLKTMNPKADPAKAFDALHPVTKRELVMEAQDEFRQAHAPADRSRPAERSHNPLRQTGKTPPGGHGRNTDDESLVDSAVKFLSRS